MLDRVNGEVIGTLGRNYVIDPLWKWTDTAMWSEATKRAVAAFLKKGAILPISFDEQSVLIQVYPDQGRIAFVFARNVAGAQCYVPVVIVLGPNEVAQLKMAGRWPMAGTVH
jgi:hypothetical protein